MGLRDTNFKRNFLISLNQKNKEGQNFFTFNDFRKSYTVFIIFS